MEKITIPPYCDFTLRTSDSFLVMCGEAILGPNSSSDRVWRARTADEPLQVSIDAEKDTKLSKHFNVRPNPKEENNGIPIEVSAPVTEPTIQELIRQYVKRELVKDDPDHVETPDEFFDFEVDDDEGHLFSSQYEEQFEEMREEEPLRDSADNASQPPQDEKEQDPPPPASADETTSDAPVDALKS